MLVPKPDSVDGDPRLKSDVDDDCSELDGKGML